MRTSNISYPYPVLGVGNAVDGSITVEPKVQLPSKKQLALPYQFSFDFKLDNESIAQLIAEKKAAYVCEVMCSGTLLREVHSAFEPHIEFELSRKAVCRRVEILLYVSAVVDISEYRNEQANEDYRQFEPFKLEKGSTLAQIGQLHFDADLCYEDLTSLKSFLQIVKNEHDPKAERAILDTDGDFIRLELPEKQFNKFMSHQGDHELAEVFCSSLVLFALQGALAVYRKERTHRWERAIETIVQRDARFANLVLGDPSDASDIAQILLNYPFRKLGDKLSDLADDDGED